MVAFVRNCSVRMTLRLFYEYGANAFEAAQNISTRTPLSYANSLKQLILKLHLWKNIFSSFITCLLEIQTRFLFFPRQLKTSSLLQVGLILIISKMFTILCLLCLCRNREYPGNLKWTRSIDLSSKLSLTCLHIGVMLTIIKVFITLFLLCLWEQGASWQFSK